MLQIGPASLEGLVRRLEKQKEQRTGLNTHGTRTCRIHEFHVTIIIDAEFKALRHIVHLRGDYGKRFLEFEIRKHLEQRSALLEIHIGSRIFAKNVKHY